MRIGERLSKLRKDAGFDQKDLAEKLSVSVGTVSHWENDLREPSYDMLDRISALYGITVSQLFSTDDIEIAPVAPAANTAAIVGQSNFLDDVILSMKKSGVPLEKGLSNIDELYKNILLGALESHIKKVIAE